MIQSVQILQMSSQELESYIDGIALENPVMDVEKTAGQRDSLDALRHSHMDKEEDHYLAQRQRNDDDYDPKDSWNFNRDRGETLKEHLRSQLDIKRFVGKDALILDYLLDSLDERGYLTEDVSFVAECFDSEPEKVEALISVLRELEPAGICAGNLQECLKLQLRRRGLLNVVMEKLIDDCLELISKNRIPAIAARLGISSETASRYCSLVRSLDPRPGSRFYHQDDTVYIIPDVCVTKKNDAFSVTLNCGDAPEIRVNSYYQNLLQTTDDKDTLDYLENKIRQAEWLQHCITQRQETITRISCEILKRQIAFFRNGPDYLQPLKMSEIAGAIGMNGSTVSRAIDQKYLQCSWGIFPMNWFFQRKATGRDIRAAAVEEENFTPAEVKRRLHKIIESEDPKKPYSDRILSEKLGETGITISRRTVAKYREEENIPDASGRKLRI